MNSKSILSTTSIGAIDYCLFYAVFLLYSCGFLLNEISKHYSFPPIFTVLRIFFMLILFFRMVQLRLIIGKNSQFLLLSFSLLSIYYLLICIPSGDFIIGLKTLRAYLEPLLCALMVYVYRWNGMSMNHLSQIYIKSVLITAFVSIVFYIIFWTGNMSYFIPKIPLTSFLPGGIILRSYLPIGCPNQLGLLLFSGIVLVYLSEMQKKKMYFVFLAIALVLTISKSAMLAALFFFGVSYFLKLRNIKKLLWFLFVVFIGFGIIEIFFFDSPFHVYITNLFSGDDPSSNGHITSLVDAIKLFPEYYLFGYPTGTVGSRVDTVHNVESSYFILMYDKGVLFMFIYLYVMFMLLADSFKITPVRQYIYAILLALSVLPTIQSLECFSLVLISPLLLTKVKPTCNV